MTGPDDFRPARDQDAWPTIRGFKYQIDLTILRWLALAPYEHLDLECGEDIDHVAKAFTADSGDAATRKLEQVRLRGTKLSLRSASALQTLANAVGHRNENPDLDLRFCYTTNSAVARERPNPFPGKLAGIELWEKLRQGRLADESRSIAVRSLQQFLCLAAKPKDVASIVWNAFVDFTKSAGEVEFLDFVQRFEWSCAAPDADVASDEVRNRLRFACDRTDVLQINELYQRLFVFVLRLMTQPGIKRLTRQDLHKQMTALTLSESDHAILKRLEENLGPLEKRFGEIESTVEGLSMEVQSLATQHRIAIAGIGAIGAVSLAPPPLVDHLSHRKQAVAQILGDFDDKEWLALFGLSDTGKTHLAALVAREHGGCRGWIRFGHSVSIVHGQMLLHESLRLLGEAADESLTTNPYRDACRRLGAGSCLVLDDLPQLFGDDSLSERLAVLADACRERQVQLISTSRFRLPQRLSTAVGSPRLLEIVVPMFSDADTCDVLSAHGAPAAFISSNRVGFINRLSSGHPLLITLAARFMCEKAWQLDDKAFEAIIRGHHADVMSDELVVRLCKTLDQSQRELLYRLSLGVQAVSENLAIRLAEIDQPIARPRECLTSLIGAWVQRESERTLIVSPLVKRIGGQNLSTTTLIDCHRALGEDITQHSMSPWDAEIAIGHFLQAREFDRGGTLFLLLLQQLRKSRRSRQLRSVLGYWSDLPLPDEMDLGIRLTIRAMQFWVFADFDKPDEYVLCDLDELMNRVTKEHARSAQLVASIAALFLSARHFSRAIRYFVQSITALRGAQIKQNVLMLPKRKRPVELLWTMIVNVQTAAQLEEWIGAFKALTDKEREVVIAAKDASLGCIVLADRLLLVESRKPIAQQDWNGVLVASQHLQQRALAHGWEYLAACALRSEINIHGEFLRDIEACEPKVRAFIEDPSHTAEAKALVSGMYGKMLTAGKLHEKAVPWLQLSIETPSFALAHDRMLTLLAAATCYWRSDQQHATELAEAAAEIARTDNSIPDLEAVKAFGELAIAHLGRIPTRDTAIDACSAWLEAADRLLNASNRSNEWKDMFVLFSHVQGFLSLLAETGHAPDRTSGGDEYAAPTSGLFFTSHPERINCYRDAAIPEIMWSLSRLAWSARDPQSAVAWLNRATDEIEDLPLTYITATIRQDMIPDLLARDAFEDAIDAGLRGSEAMTAVRAFVSKSEGPVPRDMPLDRLVAEMSPACRKQVDRFAMIMAVIPAFFRIGLVAMSDREAATQNAGRLAGICRQLANAATDSRFWLGSADLFDKVASNASLQDFLDCSNSFDVSECQELRILGYLATTFAGNVAESFSAHLAVIATVLSWYPPNTATHQKLLLPYLEEFWTSSFRSARFYFRSPALVEHELSAAVAAPADQRVLAILRAVHAGFRPVGLSEAESWLHSAN